MPKKKTSSSPKKKSPLKGKKKKYKISYLQKQRKKACLEGDIDFYVTEELEKLDAEVNEKEAEVEEARKKKVEEAIAFQKQLDRIHNNPLDYKHDLYASLNTLEKSKAFRVSFTNHPEYHYIAFTPSRNKAEAEAQRYIRDTYYPTFNLTDCPVSLREAKSHRCSDLDEYAAEKRVPIPVLLKLGINFKCSGCGTLTFNYQDYATRRCFIVESDGDIVPYAKGMIFCYSCYHKYFC